MKQKTENAAWSLLGVWIYICILALAVPLVYGINDDRTMMEIVSGQYLGTPDPHTIFLGYWYSLFLTWLYGLLPQADWYALIFLLIQLLALFLILYSFVSRQRTRRGKMVCTGVLVLFFLVLGSRSAAQISFTTTAAVLAMAVFCWYVLCEQVSASDAALLFFLCFLTMQVRSHIFLMILPVCGVLWLFRMLQKEMRTFWHVMVPVAAAAALLLELPVGQQIGYRAKDWREFMAYNEDRSWVYDYDYGVVPYDGAEEFYRTVGIEKKSRARTLMNYNYTADEAITPEFFGEYIAAYKAYYPMRSLPGRIWDSVKAYLEGLFSFRFQVRHTLGMLFYGILVFWYLSRRRWLDAGRIASLAGVQALLWVGLLYIGKLPERVLISMNLMLLTIFLLEAWKLAQEFPRRNLAGGALLAFVLCILAVRELSGLRTENREMWARNENVEELKEYCMARPESFYFNDVTSLAFSTYNVHPWRQPYGMNYMSLGDWISFSPLWRQKLEQQQFGSVKEALYGSEEVYLICSFDKGVEYLAKLYDHTVCEETDRVSEFHIYRLYEDEQ